MVTAQEYTLPTADLQLLTAIVNGHLSMQHISQLVCLHTVGVVLVTLLDIDEEHIGELTDAGFLLTYHA